MIGNSDYTNSSETSMSTQFHSLVFTNDQDQILRDTWIDWRLIPAERPSFVTPKQKTNFVDIPGMNGSIDMSETLTGFPLYDMREGSLNFYVVHDAYDSGVTWIDVKNDIENFLLGLNRRVYLRDELNYYYTGRFMADWKSNSDGKGSTVTLNYQLQPYKLSTTVTTKELVVPEGRTAPLSFNISNDLDVMPVTPFIKGASSSQTFTYTDPSNRGFTNTITLSVIKKQYYGVVLSKIATSGIVTVDGVGTCVLEFRNGRL